MSAVLLSQSPIERATAVKAALWIGILVTTGLGAVGGAVGLSWAATHGGVANLIASSNAILAGLTISVCCAVAAITSAFVALRWRSEATTVDDSLGEILAELADSDAGGDADSEADREPTLQLPIRGARQGRAGSQSRPVTDDLLRN